MKVLLTMITTIQISSEQRNVNYEDASDGSVIISLHYIVIPVYNIQIVTDIEVTIENYFPAVGNIPRGRRTRGIFPTKGK